MTIKSPKKLIEVALPLDAINVAAAREKSIRHGHPSTLHLWWARRPLAAARAVIFSQMVNDPSWKWEMEHSGEIPPNNLKASWAASRKRLFKIIEDLVLWDNTTNETVLERARAEIRKSWIEVCELNKEHPQAADLFNPDKLPAFHDPFAGGGALPLEAQRLGLESYASDLNPVAVMINKAMIEIPPRFAGRAPVGPIPKEDKQTSFKTDWPGATGLAEDVRRYGAWMREEAFKRIGHLYPKVDIKTGLPVFDFPLPLQGERPLNNLPHLQGERPLNNLPHLQGERPLKNLPPLQGECRGGDGVDIEVSVSCKNQPHPHPNLPLEGEGTKSKSSESATVIAWLWARTVKSPNPAFSHVDVPLISTFILSSKAGKEAYIQPIIHSPLHQGEGQGEGGVAYRFEVKIGVPPESAKNGTKAAGRGANFICLLSSTPISGDYIKSEGKAGRMSARLMAVVGEGVRGRIYLAPTDEMEAVAKQAKPEWRPAGDVPARLTGGTCVPYGLKEWGDLFTPRQLVALTTFSDLVQEAREKVKADALAAGMPDDRAGLDAGGTGTAAYADAVAVYLGFAIDKMADSSSSLTSWTNQRDTLRNTFARQALPMVWDFAEANLFSDSAGNILSAINWIQKFLECVPAKYGVCAVHSDAQNQKISESKIISTDPPYYDNIGYADLSDFFYVWLRKALRPVYPELFSTISVPKAEELVATPYRHGSKEKAEVFFLDGMTNAMHRLAEQAHAAFPVTIYYAFKQSETSDAGTGNTGWETFLDAVLRAGFALTGTWPMRTEREGRTISSGTNTLASSIVLVCRKREADASTISRREFIRELNAVLPEALDEMTKGAGDDVSPVAPVDLSQSIIGPGMAVFSKYAAVLEADGSAMTVRTALQLINRFLAEDDFDSDTQFCLHWFEQNGWGEGRFGDADTLSRAKGTSVSGVAAAGVVESGGGNVRLIKWPDYPTDWDPSSDTRNPVWETLHHLIRALKHEGETSAGKLLADVKNQGESVRQLAYRLYTLCERQGWAEDARAYNELITSWTGIESAAGDVPGKLTQGNLF